MVATNQEGWGVLQTSSRVEARDASKHPAMCRTVLATKNYLVLHVTSAEGKKPCLKSGTSLVHLKSRSGGG